jgi:hypothetical protein
MDAERVVLFAALPSTVLIADQQYDGVRAAPSPMIH